MTMERTTLAMRKARTGALLAFMNLPESDIGTLCRMVNAADKDAVLNDPVTCAAVERIVLIAEDERKRTLTRK